MFLSLIIITLCRSRWSNSFWLGLNDLATEAVYKWSDGSNYDYANWNFKEPNDAYRQENCNHLLRGNGKWNDNHCEKKFSYICKAYNSVYQLTSLSPSYRSEDLLLLIKYVILGINLRENRNTSTLKIYIL